MAFYMCSAVKGAIPEDAKSKIASDITDIHCEITGAPRALVHIFFFEDAPQLPISGKIVFLFGRVRLGCTTEQKFQLVTRIKASLLAHAGIPLNEIIVTTADVPASWFMEGGVVGPEIGVDAA